jgi:uncharacterized phage protein (TIGR01671 family)
MKEIKFRGKTKDGIWHYGWLWQSPDKKYWIKEAIERTHSADYEVIPETIGQYTGLKDKNGKEIYKGDIVKSTDPNWGYGGQYDKENDGYLRNEVPSLDKLIREGAECEYTFLLSDECEVIGNIYENPKLLEVKDELSD